MKTTAGSASNGDNFQDLADSTPAMLWRINASFDTTWANRTWFDFTGGSLETEDNFAWTDKIHPDDRERVLEEFDRAFSERIPFTVEFWLRRHDGAYRWVLDSGAPVYRGGKFDGFVGSAVDITDRKEAELRAERLQEELVRLSRAEAVSSLASMIVHELGQPLQAISSHAFSLKRIALSDENVQAVAGEIVNGLQEAIARASTIVRNCKSLAVGRKEKRSSVDLADALLSAERLIRELPGGAGADVEFRLERGLNVDVNPAQVEQVVLNLAHNALDAMPGRPRRLRITSAAWGQHAIVTVTDWGTGIEPALRGKIFEEAVSSKRAGMGIGLYVCRTIVTSHGGRIWATDNPGGGTTIKFTLPLG